MAENPANKERFFAHLKADFFPRLRAAGFTGSGQNFRRLRGEVIQALNIQGNRYGGSCTLNLGIHPVCLPVHFTGAPPDPKKLEEAHCQFRHRLAPAVAGDGWWSYDGPPSPEASAAGLIERFFDEGEAHFARFASLDAILGALDYETLAQGEFVPALRVTRAGGVLAAARLHAHRGDRAMSRRFAELGLAHLGQATGLRPAFEALLHE